MAISALVDSACGLFVSHLGEFGEKVSRNTDMSILLPISIRDEGFECWSLGEKIFLWRAKPRNCCK